MKFLLFSVSVDNKHQIPKWIVRQITMLEDLPAIYRAWKGQSVGDWKGSCGKKGWRVPFLLPSSQFKVKGLQWVLWRAGRLPCLVGRHREPREDEERKSYLVALQVRQRRNAAALGRVWTSRLYVCVFIELVQWSPKGSLSRREAGGRFLGADGKRAVTYRRETM